jgi:hypothetical protein
LRISSFCRAATLSSAAGRFQSGWNASVVGELLGSGLRGAAIQPTAEARRLRAQNQVIQCAQFGDNAVVLAHHADVVRDGISRATKLHALTAQIDFARVGRVVAVENAHQRRLARAVLAHNRMQRACHNLQVHRIAGNQRAEPLRYPAHRNQSRRAIDWRGRRIGTQHGLRMHRPPIRAQQQNPCRRLDTEPPDVP